MIVEREKETKKEAVGCDHDWYENWHGVCEEVAGRRIERMFQGGRPQVMVNEDRKEDLKLIEHSI